jgi:hypothetical protein
MVQEEEERILREEGDRLRRDAEKEVKMSMMKEEREKLKRLLEEMDDSNNDDYHDYDSSHRYTSSPHRLCGAGRVPCTAEFP